MNTEVSVGITTVIGYLTTALAALPIIIKTIEEGAVAFQGPEKYLAILSIVVGGITTLGRMIQAAAKQHGENAK